MKLIDLLRLLRNNFQILIITPVILALAVAYFTRKPVHTFSSETTIYTGIASGGSIDMDKSFSYFANNTAFDNLINIIKSRETQQEIGIRLLAEHLMLEKYDPKYISKASFDRLRRTTPAYVYNYIVKDGQSKLDKIKKPAGKKTADTTAALPDSLTIHKYHKVQGDENLATIAAQYGITETDLMKMNGLSDVKVEEGQLLMVEERDNPKKRIVSRLEEEHDQQLSSLLPSDTFSMSDLTRTNDQLMLPPSINRADFEKTVKNLTDLVMSSDTNYVYRLLNFSHPNYSIKSISRISAQRIGSSDLVKVKYSTNDPGICQQTLVFLTQACVSNYKILKENRSDAVVKYFEYQVKQALARLNKAEDKLLKFNEDNKIINYYEQSKAVAITKEDIEVAYYNQRIKLAGAEAAIKRIEEKIGLQQMIQLNSSGVINTRNELADVNEKIATIESIDFKDPINSRELVDLKKKAETLKDELRDAVNSLYSYNYSLGGLPLSNLLKDWIANVILFEETRAGMEVLRERITEFQKQYSIYAPAGANLKRIEREINVYEQEFLELLHGLNLAKLKDQDAQLASDLKSIDPPFYPLSPDPTKRKMLIALAGILGFIVILAIILLAEYFDSTLRNPSKAEGIIKIKPAGMFPKIFLKTKGINFPFVTNRLLELIIQQFDLFGSPSGTKPGPKTVLFFSSLSNEGKSVITQNLAYKLKKQGKKVLVLVFSRESLRENELKQLEYPGYTPEKSRSGYVRSKNRFSFLAWILGYPDHRVNYESPFLGSPQSYLNEDEFFEYSINQDYYSVKDYRDIMKYNHFEISFEPDYVLVEIPPIVYYSYPASLVSSADIPLLICRANRSWSAADNEALINFSKSTQIEPKFIINGVELEVLETVMGDLPRKRSWFRRILKNVIRMKLHPKYQP